MAVKDKPIIFSVTTIGITSIVSQIVFLRELIIVFYGNEISVGTMLACWLFLGAAGSLVLGKFTDTFKGRISTFCVCQLFLSIILPVLIIFIRNIRHIFGYLPGEIMPLGILVLSSPVVIAPICVTLGFLFALSCMVFPEKKSDVKIGRVYIYESAGAAVGGLITSFFLIRFLTSMQILLSLAAVNLAACITLASAVPAAGARKTVKILSYSWLLVFTVLIFTGSFTHLENESRSAEWKPFKLIASKDSIYGNVTVAKSGEQISFFTNGLHNFTVPDRLSQEEAVHFAFSQHKDPKDVLIIGGGAGGLLWEINKYPVDRIDYVELDPLIIKLARRFLSKSEFYALDSPKVKIVNTDGRFFIKNTSSRYDIIIVYTPDPYTAQLNRFYTKEFFSEVKAIMKERAVLSFGVTSSENYISRELGNFLGSIYNTLRGVFSDVAYIPGDTVYFLAANKKDLLTTDHRRISESLLRRKVNTGFINKYYLFSKLSEDRIDYITGVLEQNRDVSANLDFRPISYYYDMILWSAYFRSWLRKATAFVTPRAIWFVFAALYLFITASGWLFRKSEKGLFVSALTAIGTTGFSEIVYEIVVILSFQIIYGFLYYKLGLMLTSFMIGLFLGSLFITQRLDRIKNAFGVFTKIQIGVVLYPMLLPVIFVFVSSGKSPQLSWAGSNIVFPMLPLIAGFIGGVQFPVGNKIYLSRSHAAGKIGGLTYGIDLLGACLGAMIVSAFLIPIIGIFQTCLAIALLNFSVLLSLLFCSSAQEKKLRILPRPTD